MNEDNMIVEVVNMDESQRRMQERLVIYMELLQKFVRVRDVDREKLADMVVKAKGPRRSMRQFAEEIGVSPSTLTRIANLQTNSASKDELIVKIAAAADPDSGVTLEMLMDAHGVEEPKGTSHDRVDYYKEAEKRMRQIVVDELLTRGYSVNKIEVATKRDAYDLVVETNAVEDRGAGGKWAFEFSAHKSDMPIVGSGSTNRWIDRIMALFYRGEAGVDKVTIVMERSELYEQLVGRLKDYRIPDEMSVILVVGGHVKKEFIVPMRDREPRSIFNE